jgi:hypothetical protein
LLAVFPLLFVWKGLTPPLAGRLAGISIRHGFESLGYGGLFAFLIAPGYFRFSWPRAVTSLVFAGVANTVFKIMFVVPAASLASKILVNSSAIDRYGLVCGDLLLASAAFFLIAIGTRIAEFCRDEHKVLIHIGLLAVLIWPMMMSVQYSSRYSLMALPLLVIAAEQYYSLNLFTLVRTLAGGLLGAAVLSTYYWR